MKYKIGDKFYASTSIGVEVRTVSKIMIEIFENREKITYFFHKNHFSTQTEFKKKPEFRDYIPMFQGEKDLRGELNSAAEMGNNLMENGNYQFGFSHVDKYWETEEEAKEAFKAWKREDIEKRKQSIALEERKIKEWEKELDQNIIIKLPFDSKSNI